MPPLIAPSTNTSGSNIQKTIKYYENLISTGQNKVKTPNSRATSPFIKGSADSDHYPSSPKPQNKGHQAESVASSQVPLKSPTDAQPVNQPKAWQLPFISQTLRNYTAQNKDQSSQTSPISQSSFLYPGGPAIAVNKGSQTPPLPQLRTEKATDGNTVNSLKRDEELSFKRIYEENELATLSHDKGLPFEALPKNDTVNILKHDKGLAFEPLSKNDAEPDLDMPVLSHDKGVAFEPYVKENGNPDPVMYELNRTEYLAFQPFSRTNMEEVTTSTRPPAFQREKQSLFQRTTSQIRSASLTGIKSVFAGIKSVLAGVKSSGLSGINTSYASIKSALSSIGSLFQNLRANIRRNSNTPSA